MGLGIMSQRDLHASQPGLPPHGGLMAPSPPPGGTGSGPSSARAPGASHAMHHGGTHERALALGMGPYRSSSVHSVESTLSNAIDHSIDDEGEPYGMDGLLRRASPPHKKGPLSLPPGAPTLGGGRRAFSEGALGADHLGWGQQLGGSGLAGSPFEPHDEELQDDDATEPVRAASAAARAPTAAAARRAAGRRPLVPLSQPAHAPPSPARRAQAPAPPPCAAARRAARSRAGAAGSTARATPTPTSPRASARRRRPPRGRAQRTR